MSVIHYNYSEIDNHLGNVKRYADTIRSHSDNIKRHAVGIEWHDPKSAQEFQKTIAKLDSALGQVHADIAELSQRAKTSSDGMSALNDKLSRSWS